MMAKLKSGAVIAVLAARDIRPGVRRRSRPARHRQRGLWDSSIAEIGQAAGIFRRNRLELEAVYRAAVKPAAVISSASMSEFRPEQRARRLCQAPVRIIAGERPGPPNTISCVRVPAWANFRRRDPQHDAAYSTAGSGTHITALRFMKARNFTAPKLTATGGAGDLHPGDVGPG
jgi:NitT/TauT family transport system substrate-binding protein